MRCCLPIFLVGDFVGEGLVINISEQPLHLLPGVPIAMLEVLRPGESITLLEDPEVVVSHENSGVSVTEEQLFSQASEVLDSK